MKARRNTDANSHPEKVGKRGPLLRALGAIAVVIAWLAIAGVGGPAIGNLSSVQSNSQTDFLPKNAESVKAAQASAAFTDNTAIPAFVLFEADSEATPAQIAAWKSFVQSLPSLPLEVGGKLGDYLAPAPVIPTLSADKTSQLAVVLLSNKVNELDSAGAKPLRSIVTDIRTAATAASAGASAHVGGPAGLAADLGEAFAGIDGLLLLVTLLAVLLILVLVYRAVALPLVVLFNSISALALGGGLVYLLAKSDAITLNGQSQGILFILVVGAATDYGLLLVARYREELTRNEHAAAAMKKAWKACVEPILASAGTVIAGLLCLLFSNLNSNRSLGPVGAVGIGAAALAALTLLPAILLSGRWLFWPRVPHFTQETPKKATRQGIWHKIAAFVGRSPRKIWVVTALLLAVAFAFVPTLNATGTKTTDVFVKAADSVAAQDILGKHFSDGAGDPVLIITTQEKSAAVIAAATSVNGVVGADVKPGRDGKPLVINGLVEVEATLGSADASDQAIRDLRGAVQALDPGALVGGSAAQSLDTNTTAENDLLVIIPIVLLVVLLVLIALLRSIVAPLLLVGATVLSFGASLGVSAIVFNHIFGFPGSDPGVPLFAFVFLVALGVDYSIFLMSRAREEVLLLGPREGVLDALRVTGGVITSAGVVLAATFAALAVIPLLFLVQIAFIVAFGVLLDALVVRTLLVPALVIDLGKKAWWPSKISK
ncbi:MMPL family transporter [Nakamurella antarctica]|uniref:MMPL family transporter n=1 Tax=Nakamurella antarctica TaxID=1902245 RepID=A0A3G8ZZA2_9ACTN|nr:MMPL family transporter [Nakamurella antarctica]